MLNYVTSNHFKTNVILMKKNNPVWNFFASVKLALFTLVTLAITSIIGTIIPQKENLAFYAGKYGESTAKLFQVLDFPDMYNSWWFLALLSLLSMNLIICSFDRFPNVWKQIKADNLSMPFARLERMNQKLSWSSDQSQSKSVDLLQQKMSSNGWKTQRKETDDGTLLFSQKGGWSRTGVYIVHTSILVIFIGAIIGALLGFKGSVLIYEGRQSDKIYSFKTGKSIDLGFTVRCDKFDIEYYKNGMPKDYRSNLTVLENGKEVYQTPIEVNSPMKYKGITFYQSSYEGSKNFILNVTNLQSGKKKSFAVPFQEQTGWKDEGLRFGIINAEQTRQDRIVRMKIWFTDELSPPSTFWMEASSSATIERKNTKYLFEAKQMYGTGLQVAKDPGVWFVYIGCGLMLFGLYVAFFLSHKRIWLHIAKGTDPTIIMSGSANKNRVGFEKQFNDLGEKLRENK